MPESLSTATTRPAGYYPIDLGDLRCLAVSDGQLGRDIIPQLVDNEPEEARRFLIERGVDLGRQATQLSCLLVVDHPAGGTILVDGGMGRLPSGAPSGPVVGQLPGNLRSAGVEPEAVDTILVSHLHPDHVGGFFDGDDQPVYPNATFVVPDGEVRFWAQDSPDVSGQMAPPPVQQHMLATAKRFLALAEGRMRQFATGETVLDGIATFDLSGHAPGQVGYELRRGEDTLLFAADAFSHQVIGVERPEWRIGFDMDSPTAVARRHELLARLAAGRTRFFAPHFPWPSLGRVGTVAGERVWTPEVYRWA